LVAGIKNIGLVS
jgi:hypothetical protein